MTEKLKQSLIQQKQQNKQEVPQITGILGIPLDGQRRVEVSGRNSYVYVRLRNNENEVIQAFNNQVTSAYNLPVLLERQGNRYIVIGVDTQRYENNWNSFAPFLPRHGNTHSFDLETGGGGDVVWVYPRQFTPLLTMPSGSMGGPNVIINPYMLRNSDGTWKYIGNTGTANLTTYNPSTGAVIVLVYVDSVSGNPGLLVGSGTVFNSNITGVSQISPYIPTITNPDWIPDSAIRLVTGTAIISWNNIYDVRQFLHPVPTGTGGGLSSIAVQDEGIAKGNVTTFNFVGSPVDVSVSGSVARIFVTGSSGSGSTIDVLFTHSVDAGNSGTSETDLYSDTLAAGQLATNGDIIEASYGGLFISSATATRQLKLKFAGTTIFDTGALSLSISAAWTLFVSIIRVSSTVIRYAASLTTEGAALSAYTDVGELTGLTLSSTNILKITGQAAGVGAASNDIIAQLGSVVYITDSGGGGGSSSLSIQDEGVSKGTATIFNVVGGVADISVSGTVARLFVTGSSGGSISAQDEGVPLGSPSTFNFVGGGVDASISGSVVRVHVTGSIGDAPSDGTLYGRGDGAWFRADIEVQKEGSTKTSYLRTLNFVGDAVDVSVSGTVTRVAIDNIAEDGPQGFGYNYVIRTTANSASGTFNVALKTENSSGNSDPSSTDKLIFRIGEDRREVTSALNFTMTSGTNWFNAGGAELTGQTIDYFVYVIWEAASSAVRLGMSRIPYAETMNDFVNTTTSEKYIRGNYSAFTTDDEVELIGRVRAIKTGSIGAWTSSAGNVFSKPIYETEWLTWQPAYSASASMTYTSVVTGHAKYKIAWRTVSARVGAAGTIGGTPDASVFTTLPFEAALSASAAAWGYVNIDGLSAAGFAFMSAGTPDRIAARRYDSANWSAGADRSLNLGADYEIA